MTWSLGFLHCFSLGLRQGILYAFLKNFILTEASIKTSFSWVSSELFYHITDTAPELWYIQVGFVL